MFTADMLPRTSLRKDDWLVRTIEAVRTTGVMIIEDFLSPSEIPVVREHLYAVQRKMIDAYGIDRMKAKNEVGILRVMMKHDPFFIQFLERPDVLRIVDATVSETAILYVQTGILLPPAPPGTVENTFQFQFHRDFPRFLNGYLGSIDIFYAIDEFSTKTGATRVVPGTHQKPDEPTAEYISRNAVSVECPPGSVFVFDSTLWHASGFNSSGKDRLAMNHMFARSFFKQQFDYCRLLGPELVKTLSPRTQQILGYYTRVPSSFDEYYLPTESRFYRSGQG